MFFLQTDHVLRFGFVCIVGGVSYHLTSKFGHCARVCRCFFSVPAIYFVCFVLHPSMHYALFKKHVLVCLLDVPWSFAPMMRQIEYLLGQ